MSSYGKDMLGIDLVPKAVTGMTWQAQLAEKIFNETGDKKLKDMWGEHNWRVSLIDELNKFAAQELAPGSDKVLALSAKSKVSKPIAQSFLKNISAYQGKAKTGSAIQVAQDLATKITEALGNVAKGAGDTANTLPVVIGILAVGVAGYLIFAGKKGTKLTPF
jgi:hypothetical protein